MNNFLKIFGLVIVVAVLIVAIQKIFFKAQSTDKEISAFVNTANKTCPSMIDPETRLDKVMASSDKNLQFNYTLIHQIKDSLPVDKLKRYMEPRILQKIRTSPTLNQFLYKNLTWIYSYNDMKGDFIFNITYTPEQYK
jgi:hypothetical protein